MDREDVPGSRSGDRVAGRSARRTGAAAVAPGVVTLGIVLFLSTPPPTVATGVVHAPMAANPMTAFDRHVQHIVIIVMENHAYDNLFGTYCLRTGPYCSDTGSGISKTLCVPLNPNNASQGCYKPYYQYEADRVYGPMFHTEASSLESYNNGSMNGFYLAEHSGFNPLRHYNDVSTSTLWDLAEEYGLDDHFFSATLSYSLPNHWHLVAGQAPAAIQAGTITPTGGAPLANRSLYLDEANKTKSIEDDLLNSSASWFWYDAPIGTNYSAAIDSTAKGGPAGVAYSYWNPQAAKAESYNKSFSPHFVINTQFYKDAAAGNLPNVSWVIPFSNESDHPPNSHLFAEDWIASVVDAVEASPDWNTSAIFLTWDDYGGFYDGVAPPSLNGVPLGFRVPLLVIGPYVRENYIGHGFADLDSLLRLVELRYNLPCFTPDDCKAAVPLGFFNFSMPPRAPMLFGMNASRVSYPMPLQNLSAPWTRLSYVPSYTFLYPPLLPDGLPDLGED